MSIYTQLFEYGSASTRAVNPEAIAAASKAGEKALAEVLTSFPLDKTKTVSGLTRSEMFNWQVTRFDDVGLRAVQPLNTKAGTLAWDTLDYSGTRFHFLDHPQTQFDRFVLQTNRHHPLVPANEFPAELSSNLLPNTRVILQRSYNRPLEMRLADGPRSAVSEETLKSLLDKGNSIGNLTKILAGEGEPPVAVRLMVNAPGRSTSFNFARPFDLNEPTNRLLDFRPEIHKYTENISTVFFKDPGKASGTRTLFDTKGVHVDDPFAPVLSKTIQ